eukprot:2093481-Prorocentrum_lima.AAC.1
MGEPDYFSDPDKGEDLMEEVKEDTPKREGRLNHPSRKGINWKNISCLKNYMKYPCRVWKTWLQGFIPKR